MNPEQIIPEEKPIISPAANAVSVYGGDALDDFPVLKAFQQYVDAEHSKAQRRLLSVCAFFTMLIIVIIGVFLFVVMNIRKDPSTEATIKALTENNHALQRQMMEQSAKLNEQLMAQLAAGSKSAAPQPAARQSEITEAELESAVEIAKLKAELEHMKSDAAKTKIAQTELFREKENRLREELLAEQKKRITAEKERREAMAAEKALKEKERKLQDALAAEKRKKAEVKKPSESPKPARASDEDDHVDKFLAELDVLLDQVEKGKSKANAAPEATPPAKLDLGDSGWTIPLE